MTASNGSCYHGFRTAIRKTKTDYNKKPAFIAGFLFL
jgi:hypothetical protein